jgi:hypothetical protein
MPGGCKQTRPATLADVEREHFALRSAATYTTLCAFTAGIGGWLLMLLSAMADWLFVPALLALALSGLLIWKSIRIARRLRTLDDFIQ